MRLWQNVPILNAPEGRFPVALRRDGTQVDRPFFLLMLDDPSAAAALAAYASACEGAERDPQYIDDVRALALRSAELACEHPEESHPDRAPHRVDDPLVLEFARSGLTLRGFMELCVLRATLVERRKRSA